MKCKLREKIATKHPIFRYFVVGIMNCRSKRFREGVIALANEPNVFYFRNMGNLNSDKNICILGTDDNGITQGGLLSELRNLLVRFAMCEHFNFIPVVEFKNCLYDEKTIINGTRNPFEYYFCQPQNISVDEAKMSRYVYISRGIDCLEFGTLNQQYTIGDAEIIRFGTLYKKYLHLNEITKGYIEEQKRCLFNQGPVLGVHIRGGDFNKLYDGHPIPVTPEEYFIEIDKLLEKKRYARIFLATDDKRVLEKMLIKYGDKLLYFNDTLRTCTDVGIHTLGHEESGVGYRMGLEVLRDLYILAETDGLVTGYSGVGLFARIIRTTMEKEYKDLVIMDNGICHNGKKFPQRKK